MKLDRDKWIADFNDALDKAIVAKFLKVVDEFYGCVGISAEHSLNEHGLALKIDDNGKTRSFAIKGPHSSLEQVKALCIEAMSWVRERFPDKFSD